MVKFISFEDSITYWLNDNTRLRVVAHKGKPNPIFIKHLEIAADTTILNMAKKLTNFPGRVSFHKLENFVGVEFHQLQITFPKSSWLIISDQYWPNHKEKYLEYKKIKETKN